MSMTPEHCQVDNVMAEVNRAASLFPLWPTDPMHAVAILQEECGELVREVLQLTYEPHKSSRAKVRTEAIQTAAMALRFLASLDVYEYRGSTQHTQSDTLTGRPIEQLELTVRAYNVLRADGILTVGQLVDRTAVDLAKLHGLGTRGLADVRDALDGLGLRLRGDK